MEYRRSTYITDVFQSTLKCDPYLIAISCITANKICLSTTHHVHNRMKLIMLACKSTIQMVFQRPTNSPSPSSTNFSFYPLYCPQIGRRLNHNTLPCTPFRGCNRHQHGAKRKSSQLSPYRIASSKTFFSPF
jgi:hypothetical protein